MTPENKVEMASHKSGISRDFATRVRGGVLGLLVALTPAAALADSQTNVSNGHLFGCSYLTLTIPGTDIKTGLLDITTVNNGGHTKEYISTELPKKTQCDYLGNEPLTPGILK
jgi:hypothetical protein